MDLAPRSRITAVIPAKAGIHASTAAASGRWIPAFAGMTMAGMRAAVRLTRNTAA
jgi:hypothetical protein